MNIFLKLKKNKLKKTTRFEKKLIDIIETGELTVNDNCIKIIKNGCRLSFPASLSKGYMAIVECYYSGEYVALSQDEKDTILHNGRCRLVTDRYEKLLKSKEVMVIKEKIIKEV